MVRAGKILKTSLSGFHVCRFGCFCRLYLDTHSILTNCILPAFKICNIPTVLQINLVYKVLASFGCRSIQGCSACSLFQYTTFHCSFQTCYMSLSFWYFLNPTSRQATFHIFPHFFFVTKLETSNISHFL